MYDFFFSNIYIDVYEDRITSQEGYSQKRIENFKSYVNRKIDNKLNYKNQPAKRVQGKSMPEKTEDESVENQKEETEDSIETSSNVN